MYPEVNNKKERKRSRFQTDGYAHNFSISSIISSP
jgi:hypothetical protein